jgi:hypothetical protein
LNVKFRLIKTNVTVVSHVVRKACAVNVLAIIAVLESYLHATSQMKLKEPAIEALKIL